MPLKPSANMVTHLNDSIHRLTGRSLNRFLKEPLEKNSNQTLWADSAYYSAEIQETLSECKIKSRVHRKGYRNKALSEFQQKLNTKKSKVRARVEHVFGRMNMMHDNYLKSIGQLRAASRIGIRNLIYNLTRYEFLVRVAWNPGIGVNVSLINRLKRIILTIISLKSTFSLSFVYLLLENIRFLLKTWIFRGHLN